MKKYWKMQQTQQQKEAKTVDVYFYENIESDGWNWWTGEKEPSETSANTFLREIEGLGELDSIVLHINSLGGDCKEANAISNIIRRHSAKTTAYIDGYACSAASVIACACDTVIMPRNTVMFIHNPWMYTSGNAAQLRKDAEDLEKLGEAFSTIYEEKSKGKITREKLRELMDAETYLTAEECFEYGFCDFVERFDAEFEIPQEGSSAKQFGVDTQKICATVLKNSTIPKYPVKMENCCCCKPEYQPNLSSGKNLPLLESENAGREQKQEKPLIFENITKEMIESGESWLDEFLNKIPPEIENMIKKMTQKTPENEHQAKKQTFAEKANELFFNFFKN